MQIPLKAIDLCNRIKGHHTDLHFFSYYLEYLIFHLPERKLIPALESLIADKRTEHRFVEFVIEECENSGFELIRHITMRLDRDKKLRGLTREDLC